MVLDGFKSYGQRIDINGVDHLFNAITGLNGSGKSNILDAICFVLGLQNMSLARCNNLRELIYKNGATGINKASVTITFDNSNKEQSPTGYEQYDEIVIRREVNLNSRSKYWINGFAAQNNQVSDLFHSVQLNIQNPHFLIMQGRITKVLNMKPFEILAMVEEATGVSLYETKKKQTQSIIEKKESHLRSIDSLITETIKPKLDQLRTEQAGLMEYKKVTQELQHNERLYTAYLFVKHEEVCQHTASKVEEKVAEKEKLKHTIETSKQNSFELSKKITELEKRKDIESGGKLAKLEEELKKVQLDEVKTVSELNFKKDNLKQEEKRKSQLVKNLDGDKRTAKSKQNEYDKLKGGFDKIKAENTNNEQRLKKAEEDFEAISAGHSRRNDGEGTATLADQMMQAEKNIASAETEITKAEMKKKHAITELKKKEKEAANKQNIYNKDITVIEDMEKEVENLRQNLASVNFNEEKYAEVSTRRQEMQRELDTKLDKIESLQCRLPLTKFDYKNPIPNFDPKRVHGVICNLFKVKNPDHALAVEKALGGRLYQVVVDNEETGKLLLEKGQLSQRRTLIPLTKVVSRNFDKRAFQEAERLVDRGNVFPAISLVEYDSSLEAAIQHVFGDTLVCPNMDIGKKVANHPRVQKKTVTFDGEVFDPSGTLSGGYMGGGVPILNQVSQINQLKTEIEQLKKELERNKEELRSMQNHSQQYKQLKQKFDLRAKEVQLIRERIQEGNEHRLMQEIADLKNQIASEEENIIEFKEIKTNSEKNVRELSIKLKDSKALRERELKEAEQNLKKAKADFERSRKAISSNEQNVESLKLEIEELLKSAANYEQQLINLEDAIKKLNEEIEVKEQEVTMIRNIVADSMQKVKEQKKLLKAQSDEITKMQRERDLATKLEEDHNLKIKQVDHDISKIETEAKDSAKALKHLIRKNPWIEEEKHLFGNDNAGYNFSNTDFKPKEISSRIESLRAKKTALQKNVNMRANIMLSDKEKESEELSKKRKIVENDKNKLLRYMAEVDDKKRDELKKAHTKINVDFGSIFSTFLPNSNAKLSAPSGKTIFDGLEVKVAFGEVWKDSLTELSGGQRSLVALSLILALLKFHPAPLYILDEVDAALDQNHTQNTGIMIKKHFRDSQVC